MTTTFGAGLVAAIACTLPSTAAFAHAHLRQAVPAMGATVRQPPAQLTLTFSEGIEARFSSVALAGPGGRAVTVGPVSAAGQNGSVLSVGIGTRLALGTYTVHWRVTSVDSHKTQGTYRFTIAA